MKLKKYFNTKHYVVFLRKQPQHMQHVYALLFSGSVTVMIAIGILYIDYGFWHERYDKDEVLLEQKEVQITSKSPFDMMSLFFDDARDKLSDLESSGATLLEGKEVYIRGNEEAVTSSSTE